MGLNQAADWALSEWSLHVLVMLVWVSSRYSGFLPQTTNMQVRLISQSLHLVKKAHYNYCGQYCGLD